MLKKTPPSLNNTTATKPENTANSYRAIVLAGLLLFCIAPITAMATEGDKPLDQRKPWHGLLDTLQQLENQIENSPLYSDPVRRAEAQDYLVKTLAYHLHRSVIAADINNPRLVYNPGFGAPNADTYYLGFSHIDPAGRYRLHGTLGSVNQTIIGLYSPKALEGSTGAGPRIKGQELTLNKDGSFELFISKKKMGQNWLELRDDIRFISIYQIFGDWNTETKGRLLIERLDTATHPATVLTPERIQAKMTQLSGSLQKDISVWLNVFENMLKLPANRFGEPHIIQTASKGSYFSPAHWQLADDQALIIEFDDPAAASYWSFSCYTAWSDVLDIANRQASLNFTQTAKDKDGKYRIVMSARDPGVANWLDIEGHPDGIINWRVTTNVQPAAPTITVVPLAELTTHLPASTQRVTKEQRQKTITLRRQHMQRRLAQ